MGGLRSKLEAGEGTLIIEYGFKTPTRTWWTADDVPATATAPAPSRDEVQLLRHMSEPNPFVGWCHERCLREKTGKGMLTNPTNLPDGRFSFRERSPRITIVDAVSV